jgi:hypothetical protein
VAGANTVPLWYTDHKVNVSPFIGEYAPIGDIPIASVATAWDDPQSGRTIILIINEALCFGDQMEYTLSCPNQLRYNGIIVNDVPPMFYGADTPHSIVIPGIIEIPLKMRGIISYLDTRKPSIEEIARCEHVELTSDKPWEPHSVDLSSLPSVNEVIPRKVRLCGRNNPPELQISSLSSLLTCSDGSVSVASSCLQTPVHEADVIALDLEHRESMATKSGVKISIISKEDLAKRWHISLETAARTLEATTQMGMRYVEGPLERHLRTSQAHMRFPSLNIVSYTDTMFASKKSVRGYTCAQVFTDRHYFSRVYPMRAKGTHTTHSCCSYMR